jgi:hypothetical protein
MKVIFKLLFYCLVLFLPFNSFAVEKVKTPVSNEIRRPGADKIERFKSDGNFKYETDYTAKLSIWDVIGNWLRRHFFEPVIGKHAFTVWKIIEYSLAIIAIVLIVFYFIRSDRRRLFAKESKSLSIEMEGGQEDINLMNFDKLINDAIENSQYRVAIRYLYLKLLKDLSDDKQINWRAEKTNIDYINELRPTTYGKQFMEVTLLFDYAWYGDATINENSFGQIKNIFAEFYKQLRTH